MYLALFSFSPTLIVFLLSLLPSVWFYPPCSSPTPVLSLLTFLYLLLLFCPIFSFPSPILTSFSSF
jgi:hypothetical protein